MIVIDRYLDTEIRIRRDTKAKIEIANIGKGKGYGEV